MKKPSLFLIQANHQHVQVWQDLQQMAQSNDHIVVMGDALLHIAHSLFDTFPHVYCLSNEQHLLANDVQNRVKCIEYADLANLVMQFERCISLK